MALALRRVLSASRRFSFEAHGREVCHREHDDRDVEDDLDAHDSVPIMTINLMLNASDLPESRGSTFPAESAL